MKTVYQDENNFFPDENSVELRKCINRESKSLELTINLYSCHDINMKFLLVVTQHRLFIMVAPLGRSSGRKSSQTQKNLAYL